MSPTERHDLQAERQRCQEAIDAAYWTFTHTPYAQPPALVVPQAYARLAEINKLLMDAAREERLHKLRELGEAYLDHATMAEFNGQERLPL